MSHQPKCGFIAMNICVSTTTRYKARDVEGSKDLPMFSEWIQPFENAAAKRGSMWQNAPALKVFTLLATGAVSGQVTMDLHGSPWISMVSWLHMFPSIMTRCSSDAKRLRKSGQWTASWLRKRVPSGEMLFRFLWTHLDFTKNNCAMWGPQDS